VESLPGKSPNAHPALRFKDANAAGTEMAKSYRESNHDQHANFKTALAAYEDEEVAALPGWSRFSEHKKKFLMVLPYYGGEFASATRALGYSAEWYARNQKRDQLFKEAAHVRRWAVVDMVRHFGSDLLGKAMLVYDEAMTKNDEGLYSLGPNNAITAAQQMLKLNRLTGEGEVPQPTQQFISADNVVIGNPTVKQGDDQ
jgi:hypothetical protein